MSRRPLVVILLFMHVFTPAERSGRMIFLSVSVDMWKRFLYLTSSFLSLRRRCNILHTATVSHLRAAVQMENTQCVISWGSIGKHDKDLELIGLCRMAEEKFTSGRWAFFVLVPFICPIYQMFSRAFKVCLLRVCQVLLYNSVGFIVFFLLVTQAWNMYSGNNLLQNLLLLPMWCVEGLQANFVAS